MIVGQNAEKVVTDFHSIPPMNVRDPLAAKTLPFVLGGGTGRLLNPLTKYRPKPLVPFGGCFRILDFALSNCLNSGFDHAYVLTQYEHEAMAAYLRRGWSSALGRHQEFAIALPPESGRTYAGTADAVRQNIDLLRKHDCIFALVISGDHVYKMDYRNLLSFHAESGADVTIATADHSVPGEQSGRTAGMGVYVFNCEILFEALQARGPRAIDIKDDLIPALRASRKVYAYRHRDWKNRPVYWRNVGTLQDYYDASMDLLFSDPPMDPYDNNWAIRSAGGARLSGRMALSDVGAEAGVNSVIPLARRNLRSERLSLCTIPGRRTGIRCRRAALRSSSRRCREARSGSSARCYRCSCNHRSR